MKAVLEDTKPTLNKAVYNLKKASQKGKIRTEFQEVLPQNQYYGYEVCKCAHAILECIYQLEDIRKFIKRFPSPRTYEKVGISQYRWIEYHYANFVITILTLNDCALILVNATFQLGNPEKLCTTDMIHKNKWVKKTPVIADLKSLQKIVERHRTNRNNYVHRAKTPELYKVFESDDIDYLKLFSFVNLHSEPIVDKKILESAFKGEVAKIDKRLNKEISEVSNSIWKFFDSLLPVYHKYITSLRNI